MKTSDLYTRFIFLLIFFLIRYFEEALTLLPPQRKRPSYIYIYIYDTHTVNRF